MRRYDYTWAAIFGANLLLSWLVGLANHHLAVFSLPGIDYLSLRLYVGGLLVAFSALRLDARNGLIALILTGLALDSQNGAPYGASMILLLVAYAALVSARHRFPRQEPIFAIVLALLVNLFLFLAYSILLVGQNPSPATAWLKLFADLIASQLVIALITPWFFAVQENLLLRIRPRGENGNPATPT